MNTTNNAETVLTWAVMLVALALCAVAFAFALSTAGGLADFLGAVL